MVLRVLRVLRLGQAIEVEETESGPLSGLCVEFQRERGVSNRIYTLNQQNPQNRVLWEVMREPRRFRVSSEGRATLPALLGTGPFAALRACRGSR